MNSDATLKKIFQRPPNLLLSHVLGREVAVKRLLPTELIVIQDLSPDVLFEDQNGEIIHVELHGYWMKDFAVRNLIYWGLVYRDYARPPKQIVFWIGPRKVGVKDGLSFDPDLHYRYTVIDVRDIDGEFLLESEEVGEAIFAILCRLRDVRAGIARIAGRIRRLNPVEQREALIKLLVLSGLRDLTEVVKEEISDMPFTMDIHENTFLEEIWLKGQQEGLLKGERNSLMRFLEVRFGSGLNEATLRRIEQASLADLKHWGRLAISAPSLTDIFD